MAWNPLDDSLLSSSVLAGGPDVVAVLALLIASADRFGESRITVPYVAGALRMSEERVAAAFDFLSSPDPWSRNKDAEGRRIARTEDGSWRLVSHQKYRERASKAKAAERQAEYMARKKEKARDLCDEPGCGESGFSAVGGRMRCSKHALAEEPGAEG